jgi:hypothetical protein
VARSWSSISRRGDPAVGREDTPLPPFRVVTT